MWDIISLTQDRKDPGGFGKKLQDVALDPDIIIIMFFILIKIINIFTITATTIATSAITVTTSKCSLNESDS